MDTETQINFGELRIEAARWGSADFCVGKSLSDCPYESGELSKIWSAAYCARKESASRAERWIAGVARLLRFKLF